MDEEKIEFVVHANKHGLLNSIKSINAEFNTDFELINYMIDEVEFATIRVTKTVSPEVFFYLGSKTFKLRDKERTIL